jgi:hypothetical protein
MAERLSRAWTADEAAEHRRSRGADRTGEAVPMDRTAEVAGGPAEAAGGEDDRAEVESDYAGADASSGEDHRPGVESDFTGDDGRGDDPTPQEE